MLIVCTYLIGKFAAKRKNVIAMNAKNNVLTAFTWAKLKLNAPLALIYVEYVALGGHEQWSSELNEELGLYWPK